MRIPIKTLDDQRGALWRDTGKGLIIRKPWLERIFYHGKRWEMRSTNTRIRGKIKLIEAGSAHVVGECRLVDAFPVSPELARERIDVHQVEDLSLLKKWRYAWQLDDVKPYASPEPYRHPQGAVIWVSL